MKIGVIGLGEMGRRVAMNLLEAGYEVTVWNRSRSAVETLVAAGAKPAIEVAEALGGDLTLNILFDDVAIRQTLLDTEALARANPEGIQVCMATISSALAQELEQVHARHNLPYAAAPMLGRPEVIDHKGLHILMAGAASTLDRLEAPFAELGKTWRVGSQPGQAHLAKLAANFMIGAARDTMVEAATLLRSHGADAELFLSTMSESLFASPIYRAYARVVGTGTPPDPAAQAIAAKDIGYFLAAASQTGVHLPVAEAVRQKRAPKL